MRNIFLSLYVCIWVPKCFMRYGTVVDCARYEKHYTWTSWGWSGRRKIWRTGLTRNKALNSVAPFFSQLSTLLARPLRPRNILFVLRCPRRVGVRTVRICRWTKLFVSMRLSVQSLHHTIRYHFKNGKVLFDNSVNATVLLSPDVPI